MVLAADVHGMLDMGDDILGGGQAVGAEEGHEIDADEAAALGDQAQLLVGLVARQVGQRAAAGMVDRDRRLRDPRRLEAGALAAVRQVDHDLARIQPLDHLAAERR